MKRRSALTGLAGLLVAAPLARLGATAPPPPKSAWRPLFDSRSLTGWTVWQEGTGNRDAHRAIAINGGVLHFLGPNFDGPDKATFGHLATAGEFADYHLRLEFRWGQRRFAPRDLQRRNSGILYHMGPELDRLFPDCVEYQVQEGDVGAAVMVNTRALQGPLLGGTPLWPNFFPGLPTDYQKQIVAGGIARQWHPHSGPYERLGAWNTLDLYTFGDQAAHLVNGRIVNTLFKLIDQMVHRGQGAGSRLSLRQPRCFSATSSSATCRLMRSPGSSLAAEPPIAARINQAQPSSSASTAAAPGSRPCRWRGSAA